jgi:hypothetical protein
LHFSISRFRAAMVGRSDRARLTRGALNYASLQHNSRMAVATMSATY